MSEDDIITMFHENRRVYGTRKIKVKLNELGLIVSRRRINRIMKEQGLVSVYTIVQYKPQKTNNEDNVTNSLNRQFQ
ncbi:IS3 family transposase [Paenibacillus yanchengensis]|uniref:IS3 family transposase n=1 Tax=Paenibacillus yanchengensis TaxID=2035833 RepID=UPI003632A984